MSVTRIPSSVGLADTSTNGSRRKREFSESTQGGENECSIIPADVSLPDRRSLRRSRMSWLTGGWWWLREQIESRLEK